MACHGARRLLAMTENLYGIIGIEAVIAAQGVDLRAPLMTSPALAGALATVRQVVPELEVDRFLARDLEKGIELVRSGAIEAAVSPDLLPAL